MKLTNIHGLPQTLVNTIERDPYTMGDARISVTGLLRPPRIALLREKHKNELVSDAADNIWSIFGRAVHKILEDGGDEEHLTEERLYAEVRGWRVSGQVDVQKVGDNKVKITDYKTCKVWKVQHDTPEWEQQLNLYAWLLRVAKGVAAESLWVCAMLRDWSKRMAERDPHYPPSAGHMVKLRLWSQEEAQAFVEERVRSHQEAIASTSMGDEPPPCTDADRWMSAPKFLLWKEGNKRPTKSFDTEQEALSHADTRQGPFIIEERKAEPIRCTGDYCNVSRWCSQYARWSRDGT